MSSSTRVIRWLFWPLAILLVTGTTILVYKYSQSRRQQQANATPPKEQDPGPGDNGDTNEPPNVKVDIPLLGVMDKTTTQPCSVVADKVSVHSEVSGLLKCLGTERQTSDLALAALAGAPCGFKFIDIGSSVKKGDVLAIIDVPEIEKSVSRFEAEVELAESRLKQRIAKVAIAKAEVKAAEAEITHAEAAKRAATAWVVFRTMKKDRFKHLDKSGVIEGALLEEAKEQYTAAIESENAAEAAIKASEAKKASQEAKVVLADADVIEAKAQIKVATAELERARVKLGFSRIVAPFDGTITTQRPLVPGNFVRSASDGGTQQTILILQRTDIMRVVVEIPDYEAADADVGDSAEVELQHRKYPAKISRIAKSEDERTRLMPIEIDLENKDGKIRQGTYGKAMITLEKAPPNQISVKAACVVGGATANSTGVVFVENNGKVRRVPVSIGMVHRGRAEIRSGVSAGDHVVMDPPSTLADGSDVRVIE